MTSPYRRVRFIAATVCAVAVWSCADDPIGAQMGVIPPSALDTGLTALVRGHLADLRIYSQTDLPIRFVVVERRYFDQHNKELCFGMDHCGFTLAPGETATIPLGYVSGYDAAAANQVYIQWWSPDDPLRQPGAAAPVRRVVITVAIY